MKSATLEKLQCTACADGVRLVYFDEAGFAASLLVKGAKFQISFAGSLTTRIVYRRIDKALVFHTLIFYCVIRNPE
jgi:hypothetical protein